MNKKIIFLAGLFLVGSMFAPHFVGAQTTTGRTPSFVSGPSTLVKGATGTWTVNAYDPDGDLSSITVHWGDNTSTTISISGASTTKIFTKSYTTIGTKTISFTVKDSTGLSTKTTWMVFIPIPPSASSTLSVSKLGTGSGFINSNPSGIFCGSDCSETYASGTLVYLNAFAATSSPASIFAGWGGDCSFSTTTSCRLRMRKNMSVTATFNSVPSTVVFTVEKRNKINGALTTLGNIRWTNSSIVLGSCLQFNDCSNTSSTFSLNQILYLEPSISSSYGYFTDWTGDCPVPYPYTSVCTLTMNGNKNVTAWFTPIISSSTVTSSTLTVYKSGTGSGAVLSNPYGIFCGSDCSETYASGTLVTLNAFAATSSPASIFAGWGGDCSFATTTSCTLRMTNSKSATATFNAIITPSSSSTLTVSALGNGFGEVNSVPAGIYCSSYYGPCYKSFASGTLVNLFANASSGSIFAGWGGDCSFATTTSCTLRMTNSKSATATFNALGAMLPKKMINSNATLIAILKEQLNSLREQINRLMAQ